MKVATAFALLLAVGVSGCSLWGGPNPGNPDNEPYAGSPGSPYDIAANPPRTPGMESYDAYGPMSPPASNAVQTAPLR